MADAYSVIAIDCEKFTSLLSSVIWRPTNLTSLASASLGASSTKPSSFFAAVIYATISTYVLVLIIGILHSDSWFWHGLKVLCCYRLAARKPQRLVDWFRLLFGRCSVHQRSYIQSNEPCCRTTCQMRGIFQVCSQSHPPSCWNHSAVCCRECWNIWDFAFISRGRA